MRGFPSQGFSIEHPTVAASKRLWSVFTDGLSFRARNCAPSTCAEVCYEKLMENAGKNQASPEMSGASRCKKPATRLFLRGPYLRPFPKGDGENGLSLSASPGTPGTLGLRPCQAVATDCSTRSRNPGPGQRLLCSLPLLRHRPSVTSPCKTCFGG